ncbi:MAG: hypothetical protein U5L08_05240 [Xanthomonadales bacterium]|nr:hypothetical protein [Xanthomonadales bacterium]
MLTLALVLVLAPELMHDVGGAVVTVMLMVLHRYVLPKFGIHLGDEWR